MRGVPIVLAFLIAVPAAGALSLARPSTAAPLPADLTDGDLLLLLASHEGWHVARPPPVAVPAGATLSSLSLKLAARSGLQTTPADFAAFAAVDPRVAAAVLPMLAAVDQAWDMRDQAFEHTDAAGQPDLPTLVAAAILVSDTAENVVMPQVDALADAGVWPASPVADPVGVLRLGGTGNDVETIDRIVQIDPRGDDTYDNNAGGTTVLTCVCAQANDGFAIAVSIDLKGNDTYSYNSPTRTNGLGSAGSGVGLLIDAAGSDSYLCKNDCEGYADSGVGILRDVSGNDQYSCGGACMGAAQAEGVGILRDDAGSDSYNPVGPALAFADDGPAVALVWDRAGADNFSSSAALSNAYYGVTTGASPGDALFVDEGSSSDTYSLSVPRACNGCDWLSGASDAVGRPSAEGNDGAGGLSYVLGTHWTSGI